MSMRSAAPSATVMTERRVSIIGASLAAIGPLSMSLFTPAMPEIVQAFGTTEAAVKLTLSLYFAGFALSQLICGPLSDGFGRKPVTFAFMGIYLAASVFALAAPTVEALIVARFLQGFGAAVGVAISRAIVRDVFTHDRSTRILNLIGIILAVGPAIAPTIGGITMEIAGWHAIFILMAIAGLALTLAVRFGLVETVERDLSRIRPRALAATYARLLSTPYFVLASLVIGGTAGAIYTQATILPFILMDRVGLTPTAFGLAMLMQTGSYFVGSLLVRRLIGRISPAHLLLTGMLCVAAGGAILATVLRIGPPGLLSVMGPIAPCAFGLAVVMPGLTTAALAPFPRVAGAAAALFGFFQMGSGLVGGLLCAAIGDPVAALAVVVPAMNFLAVAAWLVWRRLPEPAMQLA